MNIDTMNKIIEMEAYDIDHIFYNCLTADDLLEAFETETGYIEEYLPEFLQYKCIIPKNIEIKELGGEFKNFETLSKTMFKYIGNSNVFPYSELD